MPVAQSLTITRASLSLADLVITNSPTAGADYVIPEGGLAYPDFDMRITYVPDQDDVDGSLLQAWALGIGSLPLKVDVHGSDMADLQANRRALEAAFAQSGETLTLSFGGETEEYPFIPSWPKWGVVDSGNLNALLAPATLTVPVNPMVVA